MIMDLLDEDSVRAAGEVINSSGPLFGLVNNAGAASFRATGDRFRSKSSAVRSRSI